MGGVNALHEWEVVEGIGFDFCIRMVEIDRGVILVGIIKGYVCLG